MGRDRAASSLSVGDASNPRALPAIYGDLVELGQALVQYGTSPLGEALSRTMASSTDDDESAQLRSEFWEARLAAVMVVVRRAKSRGELPELVDGRRLIEIFISPIHFRLLLTREAIDDSCIGDLARIAIDGTSGSATAAKTPTVHLPQSENE